MKYYNHLKQRKTNMVIGGRNIHTIKNDTIEEYWYIDMYRLKKYYLMELFKFTRNCKTDDEYEFNEISYGFYKMHATTSVAQMKNEIEHSPAYLSHAKNFGIDSEIIKNGIISSINEMLDYEKRNNYKKYQTI